MPIQDPEVERIRRVMKEHHERVSALPSGTLPNLQPPPTESIVRQPWKQIILIGIAGRKGAGKDTLGGFLMDAAIQYGFQPHRHALGDALKEECAAILANHTFGKSRFSGLTYHDVVTIFLNILHGEGAEKEHYRPFLQWWATEFNRHFFGEGCWVNQADRRIDIIDQAARGGREVVVVPDVRFVNEVRWLKERGGVLVKVYRPDQVEEAVDPHSAEVGLPDCEFIAVVGNDADLGALKIKAGTLWEAIYAHVPYR